LKCACQELSNRSDRRSKIVHQPQRRPLRVVERRYLMIDGTATKLIIKLPLIMLYFCSCSDPNDHRIDRISPVSVVLSLITQNKLFDLLSLFLIASSLPLALISRLFICIKNKNVFSFNQHVHQRL